MIKSKSVTKYIKGYLLALLTVVSGVGYGEIGNEWINPNQTYYKLKVGEDGVYRISKATLLSSGVDVNSIDISKIQLFRNGDEVSIYISGAADGTFDDEDFIEFYGQKNDGSLDTELYKSAEDQPNKEFSIHTDTSTYYLTWSTTTLGKRYLPYADINFQGKVSDKFYTCKNIITYNSSFFRGIPNAQSGLQQFSEYTGGEGFHRWIWNTQAAFNVNLPGLYDSGPDAKIKVRAYSGNHNTAIITGGYNHEFGLSIGTKSNLVFSQKLLGYDKVDGEVTISSSTLKSSNTFFMGEISYNGSGFHISRLEINYPRNFDLAGSSSLRLTSDLSSSFVEFTNYNSGLNTPVVLDLLNSKIIRPTIEQDNSIKFNLPSNGKTDFILYDESDVILVDSIELTVMSPFSKSETDYLIITNKKLKNGAEAYKSYRESSDGGSYSVSIVYVQDLYNQYGYGVAGPLAIRNFISTLDSKLINLKHILFLGKGQTYDRIRFNATLKAAYNLVPTIGTPASDYLYVSSLDMSSLSHRYAIGRIPAKNNTQIDIYLEKLKEYEKQSAAEWQKKVIQLAGGDASENSKFVNYLNSYFNIVRGEKLGGYRTLFSKTEPIPIQTSLTDKIIKEIDNGCGLVSYFGHGAAEVMDISLGDPVRYNNFGKTPVFLLNGCALGDTYGDESLAERFLFEPQKGALGWVAGTNYGFDGSLFSHTIEIHKTLFDKNYGEGIGTALKVASENYGNPNNPISVMQLRQLVYHGDPAVDIFSWEKPDYTIDRAGLRQLSEYKDSLELEIDLVNIARYIEDSMSVSIRLTENSNLKYSKSISISCPDYRSKQRLNIPIDNLSGLIKVNIELDSVNSIPEQGPFGEQNNSFQFDYLVQKPKPIILSPVQNTIISNSTFSTVLQVLNASGIKRILEVEMDSTPYFKNPVSYLSKESVLSIDSFSILIADSEARDYYLRCRYKTKDETSEWTYTTFGFIPNEEPGFTQGNKWKANTWSYDRIAFDTTSITHSFLQDKSVVYRIETQGIDRGFAQRRWIKRNDEPIIYNWWPQYGVCLVAVSPKDESRWENSSSEYNMNYSGAWGPTGSQGSRYFITGEKSGVYNFDMRTEKSQDSLISYLKSVPEGYLLVMINCYSYDPSTFKPEIWNELSSFGMSKLQNVSRGEPFAFFGTKGTTPGSAVEKLGRYNDPVTPVTGQTLTEQTELQIQATQGEVIFYSTNLTTQWEKLSLEFKDEVKPYEDFRITILGSMDRLDWKVIGHSNNTLITDLSSISAKDNPYLRFQLKVSDSVDRTPPSLSRWRINASPLQEGTLVQNDKYELSNTKMQQGEPLYIQVPFYNVRNASYDSSNYLILLTEKSTSVSDTIVHKKINTIAGNSYTLLQDTINTKELLGDYSIIISANPERKPLEDIYFNNLLEVPLSIKKDNTPPLLDVTFDGVHILDKDIVSPSTVIKVTVKDENPYLLLDSPDNIRAILTRPNGSKDTLNPLDIQVSFIPSQAPGENAELIYEASELESGEYFLEVSVNDASRNSSSENGYSVHFNVERDATITNLYPYPNPFSTEMKFVFTLTGSQLPDYFKIQIMTISGKVVREITQGELGPLKIGNNITEFSWDGTDNFGDQLANGVYLYKVTAKQNGEEIKLRETSGDDFFTNGYGKIYLVR